MEMSRERCVFSQSENCRRGLRIIKTREHAIRHAFRHEFVEPASLLAGTGMASADDTSHVPGVERTRRTPSNQRDLRT
jgi:hypothetical protein